MRRLLKIAGVALTVTLAGCATDNHHAMALTGTLDAYASTLRWGDFQSALEFVDPKWREAHPLSALDLSRYQQVRVSDYDAGQGPVPTGDTEVRQVVRIDLINRNTQQVRSVIDRQTWAYDATAKRWWLETGLPDIAPGN